MYFVFVESQIKILTLFGSILYKLSFIRHETIFLSIFGKVKIGLKLLSLVIIEIFWSDITLAIFQKRGKEPHLNDSLNISHNSFIE